MNISSTCNYTVILIFPPYSFPQINFTSKHIKKKKKKLFTLSSDAVMFKSQLI